MIAAELAALLMDSRFHNLVVLVEVDGILRRVTKCEGGAHCAKKIADGVEQITLGKLEDGPINTVILKIGEQK